MRADGRVAKAVHKVSASPAFAKVAPAIVPPLDKLVHKLTGGRRTMSDGMQPIVVLTTTGAKSGQPRTVPIACFPDGDALYVVGSNFGREKHPAWSGNLLETRRAHASVGGEDFEVDAHLLTEEEKAAMWPALLEKWPNFDVYTERSGRDLRVFRLDRVSRG
jgi:deazaflavin-dependent oxidoreductase (nitroreductase family)